MNIIEIIEKKKCKGILSEEEINFWIKGLMDESIKDYQSSALLMAIVLNGINNDEIIYLTNAILNSGSKIDLNDFYDISIDKHSTGGVGDSTSFIVLPIMAALGYKSAKFSGRSLGFTGGTLDKLESIEGLKVSLSKEEFFNQVSKIGLAIASQTLNICPADKKLYALRDVTATVDNVGLIASSIMSKKLASGAKNIVLDVKVGKGAFMKNYDDAKKLAEVMVNIGKSNNKNISAVLSNMDSPLDTYIGNSLEIYGALDVLDGNINSNLAKVAIKLCECLLENMGVVNAYEKCVDMILSKKAKEKFLDMIKYQYGNIDCLLNKEKLRESKFELEVYSNKSGYVDFIDPIKVSSIIFSLGGGRLKVEDDIDKYCGVILHKNRGEYVNKQDKIATVLYNNNQDKEELIKLVNNAFNLSDEIKEYKLIYDIIK